MEKKKYDVIVLGGGIAGYESAKALSRGGKNVGLIEKDLLGGVALRWGALPIKKILDRFKNIDRSDKNHVEKLKENLISSWDEDLKILDEKIKKDLLDEKVDIYFGDGEFIDPNTFQIQGKRLKADYFIIATGTEADGLEGIPLDGKRVISHKEAIDLNNLSKDLIILGGSVEGVEIAGFYAELGLRVILVEKEENILYDNDQDLVYPIESYLLSKNVKIIKGLGAKSMNLLEDGVEIILENNEKIVGERVLLALKRKPNFPRGIENTRIQTDGEKILVGENFESHEKNIFAIGDINGILEMAHVARQQGLGVADYILKKKPIKASYEILPRAVFTIPEMAGLGKQEWELKEEGISYKVGLAYFKDSWRAWAKGIESGFVKSLISEENIILGIWMLGENVSEYIGLYSSIIKDEKSVDEVLSNLIIHPSLAEVLGESLLKGKNSKLL